MIRGKDVERRAREALRARFNRAPDDDPGKVRTAQRRDRVAWLRFNRAPDDDPGKVAA